MEFLKRSIDGWCGIGRLFGAYFEATDEFFLPSEAVCMGCGSAAFTDAGWLCASCLQALYPIREMAVPRCPRCGAPLDERGLCPSRNLVEERFFVRSAYLYQRPIDGMIKQLKYSGVERLVPFMGGLFAHAVLAEPFRRPDFVVPVPMHPNRLLIRGYNHAERLAAPVASALGAPLQPALLRRVADTRQQAGQSGIARHHAMTHAFAASPEVRGRQILLIDDVLTTGATLKACAETLLQAGAWRVEAATLAMAIPDAS